MGIIVTGSLAYDRIMDFPDYFSNHILPDKLHVLNVCFQVNGLKENFGGTAGNIAYALTLMGESPSISACIGRDHRRYLEWMKAQNISTENIKIIEEEFTAGAYITTDLADNQITGFNPGAMKYSSSLEFEKLNPSETLIIVSPGNLDDMISYPLMCKQYGIEYIFDPGQALPMISPEDLVQAIDGCRILIVNDYEMDLVLDKTGLSTKDLLDRTEVIIVTLGESGSKILRADGEISIPIYNPRKVLDPTGAGDAYRGGLISGLMHQKSIEQSAMMGSACASFAVECYGTQQYSFSTDEFNERLNGGV